MRRVAAETLKTGDVILPPEREMRLWMRRDLKERDLPESALELTIIEVRAGAPDTRGPWLLVTTKQSPLWSDTPRTWTIRMRPSTKWPVVRDGERERLSEMLSYGIKCDYCGEWKTACTCEG